MSKVNPVIFSTAKFDLISSRNVIAFKKAAKNGYPGSWGLEIDPPIFMLKNTKSLVKRRNR